MTEDEQFAHFETMGEDHVRAIAPGWEPGLSKLAYSWLKAKDQERSSRSEASQSESNDIARSASEAAWVSAAAAREANRLAEIANTRATLALITSIITMAVSIVIGFASRG